MPGEGEEREGRRGERRLPPFASGEIAGDYTPLFEYWQEARRRGREEAIEKATLTREDFDELRREVEEAPGPSRLSDLLDRLKERFRGRVDPGIAAEAMRRAGRPGYTGEEAAEEIARLMAAWLVEAGEEWGLLRLRRPWGDRRRERP